MAGQFIRGALIQLTSSFLVPVPNVIIFQFNPTTITHTMKQAPSANETDAPLAVGGPPGQSFSFTLQLDANDQIAAGNPLAVATGIYPRIAALETLMFPTGDTAGGLLGEAGPVASSESRDVPALELPMVLFVWGPTRVLPVRVTSLSFEELLYDALLNPTHADAKIELTVLTPQDLVAQSDAATAIAVGAYVYTDTARQVFALANLANAAPSIMGMIPV